MFFRIDHSIRTLCCLTLISLSLVLAACETTRQTRSAKPSGFLGDYSQLQKGKEGEAHFSISTRRCHGRSTAPS